jgi:tryptophanyl-tRNA synthetase
MLNKVSLTGIKPTGKPHLGNLLGMIAPALELQKDYSCIYFIADLHSLNGEKNPSVIRESTYDCVATWKALGLDTDQHIMFRQSDVPFVTEYTWYLTNVTGFGFLEKAHAFKDAVAKGKDINLGLFLYPVLMAADILMYDADVVPVGKDQKQHVEMARNMAGSFNSIYGEEIIKLPTPLIREDGDLITGTDGQKMSKSYGNIIEIFAPEKALKESVMKITTDSTPLEDPKSMAETPLGQLYRLFGSKDAYADLESRLQKGGLGWGHAKLELFELINQKLAEPRKIYNELRADEATLKQLLSTGAEKATARAKPILQRVRAALEFN